MPLSPIDRLRGKRDREFQARILAALEKPKKRRCLAIINSPIVIWMLTVIFITVGTGYYTTYRQCVADARQILSVNGNYGVEIRHRQDEIVNAIGEAVTVADLRKALEKKTYFISDLKDKSMIELQATYRDAYLRIDRSGIDATPERTLISSPLFARFSVIFSGYLPPTLSDADLPDLKKYAAVISASNQAILLRELTTVYEVGCTPSNVGLIALGENPVLARAVAVTFSERHNRTLPGAMQETG
jgi:hypothetical protein